MLMVLTILLVISITANVNLAFAIHEIETRLFDERKYAIRLERKLEEVRK